MGKVRLRGEEEVELAKRIERGEEEEAEATQANFGLLFQSRKYVGRSSHLRFWSDTGGKHRAYKSRGKFDYRKGYKFSTYDMVDKAGCNRALADQGVNTHSRAYGWNNFKIHAGQAQIIAGPLREPLPKR